MKIQIIGYSGSGKSTLAKQLSEHYNIPLLYLDNTKFYDNWVERTDEEQTKLVEDFLNKNDSWVIDGNYRRICSRRFEECDQLIFLDYNRFFCYREAKKRYKKNKGTYRESCNCPEKFDLGFQFWILVKSHNRKKKQGLQFLIDKAKKEKLVFKNRKQLSKYLESIGIKQNIS